MSLQVSAIPPLKQHVAASRKFKSAEYHPAIWGDQFLEYSKSADDISNPRRYEELKEEVRKMIIDGESKTTSQKLCLIDAVQRLGVGYHFTSEIEDELNKITHDCNGDGDLYTVALRFRLLRQQGLRASTDTFQMFRDSRGRFKASLNTDVKGLLSLYEAAHLAIRGEDILDEALDCATTNLNSLLSNLNPRLAQEVQHALNRPIRKCLPRLEARHYIVAYSREESHNKNLLEFAKLDFCLSQRVHQKELSDISQWWTNLDVASRLPYARDRIVELYFWIMGVYFEPQFSLGRKIMTKIIAMLSILDDTYDNYATCEELELFTEAIQRWDVMMIDMLPEYMKMIYGILIDVYNKIEEDMAKEGRPPYCVHYAKEAMKRTVRFYFTEAKWRDRGYVPNMKEYMDVSLVSSCYPLLITTSFLGMGPIATQEAFKWACNDPKIIKASAVVCRFMDDIASHEFEQQRNHVASSVECYMKQHSSSEEETVKILRKEVADAWNDINEECLKPTAVPMPLLERALNFARVIDVIYKDGDGYTNPHLIKDYVASLLEHSVPV